ncbi:hypothetical protein J6590_030706 [Homalodisca vitripennis]|nr:hypothetical protein J6590_030706 [Homalodisca vitripennis]
MVVNIEFDAHSMPLHGICPSVNEHIHNQLQYKQPRPVELANRYLLFNTRNSPVKHRPFSVHGCPWLPCDTELTSLLIVLKRHGNKTTEGDVTASGVNLANRTLHTSGQAVSWRHTGRCTRQGKRCHGVTQDAAHVTASSVMASHKTLHTSRQAVSWRHTARD